MDLWTGCDSFIRLLKTMNAIALSATNIWFEVLRVNLFLSVPQCHDSNYCPKNEG